MKLEIDFAFAVGSKLLLGGWAVVDDDISKHQLQFARKFSDLLLFKRPDVCAVMQCSEEHSTGFLVALANISENEIEVTWGEVTQRINLAEVSFTQQLAELEALPSAYFNDATALLERNGFYWGQKSLSFIEDTPSSLSLSHKDSRIQIDYAFILDANTVLIIGWVLDEARLFKRINLRLNNVITDCILKDAFFHPRYDVAEALELPISYGEKIGFAFTVSLPEPVSPNIELIYSVDGTFFNGAALKAEPFRREETWLTEILLANVDITNTAKFPKLNKHVASAIEKSWLESIRVCRRLIILRELANEQKSNVFPRSPRASSSHGFDLRA